MIIKAGNTSSHKIDHKANITRGTCRWRTESAFEMIVGARTATNSIQVMSRVAANASGSVAHVAHGMVLIAHCAAAVDINNVANRAGHTLERAASQTHWIVCIAVYACQSSTCES